MVNLKSLEKQRIEKIQSLENDQVKNYVDIIIAELCELHDFNTVGSADVGGKRLDDIADLYGKLNEIGDAVSHKFNNIINYINTNVNHELLIAKSVYEVKEVVSYAKLKNKLLVSLIHSLVNDYVNLQFYLLLFHGMLKSLNYINQFAPDDAANIGAAIGEVEKIKVAEYKKILSKIVADIGDDIETINNLFYSDGELVDGIAELKNTIADIETSPDDYESKLKTYGIIDIYGDLLDCYEFQIKLKDKYTSLNGEIVGLIESDNAFYNYSAADFDNVSGVDFDEFMKVNPKFNLKTMELT